MNPPHEETWEIEYPSEEVPGNWVVRKRHGGSLFVSMPRSEPVQMCRSRGQLATAAPEMARLLLEMQWGAQVQDQRGCQCCLRFPEEGHAPDCKLVAALRKAGIAC
jgi:hypothetical protein